MECYPQVNNEATACNRDKFENIISSFKKQVQEYHTLCKTMFIEFSELQKSIIYHETSNIYNKIPYFTGSMASHKLLSHSVTEKK